jgi:lipopolysaccharide transport system ATP-binding protein
MLPDESVAIKVQNVSKAYRLGLNEVKHENLINAIVHSLKKPFTNYKKISALKNVMPGQKSDEVFWANKNLNFEVKHGEVVGIIGRNGAGKSTLLKILSQITEPSEGRIELRGRVSSLLEVGTGFNAELTGRENVYLNGTIMGLSKKEITERFDSIVEFSGVEKFMDTPVKRYSSGMKVRLAFAVAAHLEPDILIIDEVLAVGDAEFQRKCIGKMQELSDRTGRTVLFVSHNMSAVKKLCTRGIVLRDGELVFDGTQDEAINFYQADLEKASNLDFTGNLEKAPGNESVRIANFHVQPAVGNILSITSGIKIELVIYNYLVNTNLDTTIELRNSEEILMFHTGHQISKNKDSQVGFYKVDIEIPPNILNAGLYFISLIVGENLRMAVFRGRDMVSFEIIHDSKDSNTKARPGVISPVLKFKSEFILDN